MITLPKDGFANLADTPAVALKMISAVELCRDKGFWIPAFILASAAIDRLAGGTKIGYLDLLAKSFPELSTELAPLTFYEKFRNGIIHEFSPKPGFALGNDQELEGKYVIDTQVEGSTTIYKTLNIDRFIKDFIRLAKISASVVENQP